MSSKTERAVTAHVISCPGRLGDMVYYALQIDVEGFNSPYVLHMALPAVSAKALSEMVDPQLLYATIAGAINDANVKIHTPEQETADVS